MSCRAQIDEALADAPEAIYGQEELQRRKQVVERLAALSGDCSQDLESVAEEYVKDLGRTSERLTVVLDAMLKRGQDVTGIAARALSAPGFAEREPYVEILEEFAPKTAAGPLQEAFGLYDEDSDVEGFLRARILRALGEVGGSGEIVAQGLQHDDTERVRLAAIRALGRLDARDQAPALIERLEADNDPEVVAAAAGQLAAWDHKAAVPALEALAASEWAQRSDEVGSAASHALSRLRS
jgi:HEAT repeat protein